MTTRRTHTYHPRARARIVALLTLIFLASLLGGVAPVEARPSPSVRLSLESAPEATGPFSSRLGRVADANAPATFRVGIRNGNVPLVIETVGLTLGQHQIDVATLSPSQTDCLDVVGFELDARQPASCTATFDRLFRTYGGQPRAELVVTATVTGRAHDGRTVTVTEEHLVINDGATEMGVELIVEHDADGDGTYAPSGTATEAGATVAFRVTVRNTSHGTVRISELVHRARGTETDLLAAACPQLADLSLRGADGGCGDHDDGGCGGGCGDHDDGDCGSHDDGDGCGDHDEGDGCGGHDDGCGGGGGGRVAPVSEVSCDLLLDGYAPTAGRLVGRTEVIVSKGHGEDTLNATASAQTMVSAPRR